jgi:hypothetical protein
MDLHASLFESRSVPVALRSTTQFPCHCHECCVIVLCHDFRNYATQYSSTHSLSVVMQQGGTCWVLETVGIMGSKLNLHVKVLRYQVPLMEVRCQDGNPDIGKPWVVCCF